MRSEGSVVTPDRGCGPGPVVRRGDVYHMVTGEEVEVTFTRYYITPQGDTAQHAVRLIKPHTFRCSREVGEHTVYETVTKPKGTAFHLTDIEILRNGVKVDVPAQLERSAA